HITQQLSQVVGSVDRLTTRMEESYVRKDVYLAKHEALRADTTARAEGIERAQVATTKEIRDDIKELQDSRKDDEKHRRQQWAAISLLVLSLIGTILVSMLQGGAT